MVIMKLQKWNGKDKIAEMENKWMSMVRAEGRRLDILDQCSWTRGDNSNWNNTYVGDCGVSPTYINLPTNVSQISQQQQSIQPIKYTTMTKLSDFCGDGNNETTKMEWEGQDCGDGKIKWMSMKIQKDVDLDIL